MHTRAQFIQVSRFVSRAISFANLYMAHQIPDQTMRRPFLFRLDFLITPSLSSQVKTTVLCVNLRYNILQFFVFQPNFLHLGIFYLNRF